MSAVLWSLAVSTGIVAAVWLAEQARLDKGVVFCGALGSALAGFAGASAWTAVLVWSGLAPPPASAKLLDGDLSVLGAIVGVGGFVWLYLRALRRPLLPYADIAATAGALAYSVGRLGCFLNGCCFGTPTGVPWGVQHGPDTAAYVAQLHAGWIGAGAAHTLAVHPTALYHAAIGFVLFLLACRVRAVPGRALVVALVGYGAARFVLQFFRGDAEVLAVGLDVSQLFALVLLAAGLLLWRTRFAGLGAAERRRGVTMPAAKAPPSSTPA